MRYVLNEKYNLCGWHYLPYAIRDDQGHVKFLNKEAFDIINTCEGKIDFDMPLFDDKTRDFLKQLENEKAVRIPKDENDTRDIEYKFYENRYMREVQFAVTGKCNFRCKHCYMSAFSDKAIELPKEKVFKILEEIRDAGIFKISLTGGECLIRPDFLEIVDKIIECGMYLDTIYTNGYLVNDRLLDELEKRNIKPGFSISFDGVGWHDYMRGVEGAEKRVDETFRLLKKRGYTVTVEFCLFRKNIPALRESMKYLDSVGVRNVKVNPVSRSGAWESQDISEDISYNEVLDIYLNYIKEYFEDDLKTLDLYLAGVFSYSHRTNTYSIPVYKHCENLEALAVCGHARVHSYITEEGIPLPCPSLCAYEELKHIFPSIFDIGFANCISDSSYMNFIDKKATEILDHNKECQECEFKHNCYGGCRAAAYDMHKDLLAKDESSCLVFKSGMIDKIKALMAEIRPDVKYMM